MDTIIEKNCGKLLVRIVSKKRYSVYEISPEREKINTSAIEF